MDFVNSDSVKAEAKVDESEGEVTFNNGVNPENLEEGMVVSFRVQAKDGYTLNKLKIVDQNGNEVEYKKVSEDEYEFTMPVTNVTITPEFRKTNIIDEITNPQTSTKFIGIIIAILIAYFAGYRNFKKEKKS